MCTLPSTRYGRNSSRARIAGAVLAFTLSVPSGAFAQAGAPPANTQAGGKPANTQIIAPKQVGIWTVTGYSEGYCAAERPVPGAAGGGAPLQFVVARLRIGYRIALGAPHWELKPQTAFPIELVAQPVLRSDASAIAVGPKLVIIELGADGQFMKKLATAPMIEIKAAQATFKLPMEQFADALTAVDTCFGALKQPTSNPFAPPESAAKTASAR